MKYLIYICPKKYIIININMKLNGNNDFLIMKNIIK